MRAHGATRKNGHLNHSENYGVKCFTSGMSEETPTQSNQKTWPQFLTTSPPDTLESFPDLFLPASGVNAATLAGPDIVLHCDSEDCQGPRVFEDTQTYRIRTLGQDWSHGFLKYRCRNCRRKAKLFSLAVRWSGSTSGQAVKIGEIPTFGPHTPARVITLIGPDKELFLKGRRAENHGLGIGAFSYYRRVVNNQGSRIIKQIAKVAQKLGAEPDLLRRRNMLAESPQNIEPASGTLGR